MLICWCIVIKNKTKKTQSIKRKTVTFYTEKCPKTRRSTFNIHSKYSEHFSQFKLYLNIFKAFLPRKKIIFLNHKKCATRRIARPARVVELQSKAKQKC